MITSQLENVYYVGILKDLKSLNYTITMYMILLVFCNKKKKKKDKNVGN